MLDVEISPFLNIDIPFGVFTLMHMKSSRTPVVPSRLLSILLLLPWLAAIPVLRAEESPDPATPTLPEQKIVISTELLEAQAERIQARDRLAYSDEEAIALRQAAKSAEKHVVETRRLLEERLRIVSIEYREARHALAETGKQIRTVQAEIVSVERELAGQVEVATPSDRLVTLKADLEGLQQRLRSLEEEGVRQQEALEAAKVNALRDDPEAAELGTSHDEAVLTHQQAYDRLKEWLDAHPEIQALDKGAPAGSDIRPTESFPAAP